MNKEELQGIRSQMSGLSEEHEKERTGAMEQVCSELQQKHKDQQDLLRNQSKFWKFNLYGEESNSLLKLAKVEKEKTKVAK